MGNHTVPYHIISFHTMPHYTITALVFWRLNSLVRDGCCLCHCRAGPKRTWQTWAFADMVADAYMKRRDSQRPDLTALGASAALLATAMGKLSQASAALGTALCNL